MTIAIDHDNTFTANPMMWQAIRLIMLMCGCTVIMVTRRSQLTDDMAGLPADMPIIFAGTDQFKRRAAEKAGYKVDIWIDDEPGTVEPQRLLSGGL